jgi:hypothetical protein
MDRNLERPNEAGLFATLVLPSSVAVEDLSPPLPSHFQTKKFFS